ncbi:MAG: helicase-exonuclease AddAB subunit AddA [Firmicutes bacterium]|nr:helicase-exonuclease AddAB subunit AddA [Bacillota bacterium]
MSETQFTPAQLDAIQSREENLLVAAGAGSGKTTVLVERIIRRLRSGGKIQRLLVLTFTHAAADDMRAKIQRALSQLCREQPGNADFRQQLALLPQAHISTVHSFCLELLRSHYYRVGLPADFRVASEVEMELLRQECLEACMEQAYGDEESGLAALADAYGGVHDDSQLSQIILDLHSYSQSRPNPAQWLRQSAAQLLSGERVDQLWGAEALCRSLRQQVERIIDSLRQASLLPEIPRLYQELAWVEIAQAEQVCRQQSLQAMAAALSALEFQRLPSGAKKLAEGYPPGHVFDQEQMERFKKLRTAVKDDLKKLAVRYGGLTAAEAVEEQHRSGLLMQSLVNLVIDLDERLREAKLSRAWIDYGDMEHLTLSLLSDEDFARSLAEGFDEVLIDEYQDINQVQEAIFSRLRRKENFFAVGDVKQSVYRFRLAEPQLFLSKYLAYGEGEGGRRIDLNRNFRSHISVIQGVNHLFRQLMLAEVAELDYDEAAALHPGRPEQGAPPELWLVSREPAPDAEEEEAEEESSMQLEARFLAQRIRELRQEGYAYGDMVILLRSLKSSRDIVIRELEAAGIPISAEGAGGYLDSPELEMALSLLKLIDNPRQDQPLAGLLRSPLLGFSDEELLSLRLEQPEGGLYDCLLLAAEGEGPLPEKLRGFLAKLESWRAAAGELRPSALLLRLYEEAGFYHLCGALPGGETRQAYLRLLYQQACSYERQSYAGLYRFICQMEDSRAWGKGELSPAKAGGADSVQLMSIHKSKGLEFPVVFVAGLNHCFNFRDELGDVIWDRDLGLGARYADRERRRKYPTLAHLAIAERKHEQALAEEMRVYYVALTRAKERLILSACLERPERAAANWAQVAEWPEQQLPLHVLTRARKPLDWFGPALIRHRDSAALRQLAECSAAPRQWDESRWQIQCIPAPGPLSPEEAAFCTLGTEGDAELKSQVEAALFYQYPGREKCLFPAKWSVSSLNRQAHSPESRAELALSSAAQADAQEEAGEKPKQPASLAAERGTAYHRVLELLDLKRVELPQLKEQLAELQEKGLLSPEAGALVELRQLERFLYSPVGQRLCAAKRVQRETAFTMLMEEQGVEVLVQGMLDAAFEEEDGWVLLDYKTGGRSKSDEELRQLYGQQLSCYCQAMERLWRVPVKEAFLCMLDSGRVVAL